MLDVYVFYAVAVLTILSAMAMFAQRKLIHAVAAITAAFVGSALVFFLLGQTLIGILQLLIFVGGLSTYLIVAVATEEKNTKMIRLPVFAVVTVVMLIGLSSIAIYLPQSAQDNGPSFLTQAFSAFKSDFLILYMLVILLFSVTIAGTLVIKKFARLIV